MKRFLCAWTALILLATLGLAARAEGNLIKNGDFSEMEGDLPAEWRKEMWYTDQGISLLTVDASVDFPMSEYLSFGLSLKNIFDSRGIESARNLQAFANDGRTFELFMRYRF
jgi:outer membrane receptor protein involved in Fe transport